MAMAVPAVQRPIVGRCRTAVVSLLLTEGRTPCLAGGVGGASTLDQSTGWNACAATGTGRPRSDDSQIAFFERVLFGDGRQWICSQASGDVLEVAIGSGRNLAFHPQGIHLTGVHFSPRMLDLAQRRAQELGRQVDVPSLSASGEAASW
jgi:SAM-dependent methyltransferase